jgi:hypothetical protein
LCVAIFQEWQIVAAVFLLEFPYEARCCVSRS